MAAEGGRIDFMFLGPPLTRPLDPLLRATALLKIMSGENSDMSADLNLLKGGNDWTSENLTTLKE